MSELRVKFFIFLVLFCTVCFDFNLANDTITDACSLKNDQGQFISPMVLNDIQDYLGAPSNLFDTKIFVREGVKSIYQVEVAPNSKNKTYISYSLNAETHEFNLSVGKDFKEYEEYEEKEKMTISVSLDCGSGTYKRVDFQLKVIDTNNHLPDFLEDVYEYEIPMPFPKNIDLAPFGKSNLKYIVVKDVDLTNTNVTFQLVNNENSTDDQLFSIDSNGVKNGKFYTTVLTSKTDLKFEKEITLSVLATDNGVPPKNSSKPATIKIRPIIANEIKFNSIFYSAKCEQCKSSDKSITISFQPEIKLSKPEGSVNPKISVDTEIQGFENSFSASINETGTVQLNLLKLPENFKDDFIFLTVTASQEGFETKAYAHIALSQNQPVVEQASNGGLIAATVILSLLLVGLIIAAAYYYNKLR